MRYSEISQWLKCPQSYVYKYVDKIVDTTKSADLAFGTAIHTAIECSYDGLSAVDVFEAEWQKTSSENLTFYKYRWHQYLDMGARFMDNFERRHKDKYEPIYREHSFEFNSGHSYSGTIDFFGLHNSKNAIVDFKTSEKLYDKTKILADPQMYIYAEAIRKTTKYSVDKIMYLVFVKSEAPRIQTVEIPLVEGELNKQIENCNSIINSLHSMNPVIKNFHNCGNCNFRGMCYGKK